MYDEKTNQINSLKNYLSKMDTLGILRNISEFMKLNIEEATVEDIREKFYKTILNSENIALKFPYIVTIEKGEYFFRIRKLDESDTIYPLKSMRSINDAWNPPENYVKTQGRLNKINESLLYTTPNSHIIPLKELKIEKNSLYSLIIYESVDIIKANYIGKDHDYSELGLDENEIIKMHIINNFINNEFTRDVGIGKEYLYKLSEFIAKDFYDLPPKDFQDAWAYNSIADKKGFNVCFRPDIAKEKLQLKGVLICRNITTEEISPVAFLRPNYSNNLLEGVFADNEVIKMNFPKLEFIG